MYCSNCATHVSADANYCLKCGKQVTRPAEEATHEPASPAAHEPVPAPLTLLAERVQLILSDHARRKGSLPQVLVNVSSEDVTARTSKAATPQEMLQAVKDLTTKYPFYGAAYDNCARMIAAYPNIQAIPPVQEPVRGTEQAHTHTERGHMMDTM